MSALQPRSCVRRRPEVELLSSSTGAVFVADTPLLRGVNETAARVWELIDGRRTIGSICEAISNEFDAPREQIDRDVLGFVEQLLGWGWVEAG